MNCDYGCRCALAVSGSDLVGRGVHPSRSGTWCASMTEFALSLMDGRLTFCTEVQSRATMIKQTHSLGEVTIGSTHAFKSPQEAQWVANKDFRI